MTTQTDVKATTPLVASGPFKDATGAANVGRCRIKGFWFVSGATTGNVSIADGNGGPVVLNVQTPISTSGGAGGFILPGEGILCENGPYGTVNTTASMVLFYG